MHTTQILPALGKSAHTQARHVYEQTFAIRLEVSCQVSLSSGYQKHNPSMYTIVHIMVSPYQCVSLAIQCL